MAPSLGLFLLNTVFVILVSLVTVNKIMNKSSHWKFILNGFVMLPKMLRTELFAHFSVVCLRYKSPTISKWAVLCSVFRVKIACARALGRSYFGKRARSPTFIFLPDQPFILSIQQAKNNNLSNASCCAMNSQWDQKKPPLILSNFLRFLPFLSRATLIWNTRSCNTNK